MPPARPLVERFWEKVDKLDANSHGVCELCGAERDFSTIHARYRGMFVHRSGDA